MKEKFFTEQVTLKRKTVAASVAILVINRGGYCQQVYLSSLAVDNRSTMERAYRATLLALYQLTLLAGIALMPLALLTERLGLRLPIHRAVRRLGDAYEQTA
jgi:hypothetical protein